MISSVIAIIVARRMRDVLHEGIGIRQHNTALARRQRTTAHVHMHTGSIIGEKITCINRLLRRDEVEESGGMIGGGMLADAMVTNNVAR